MRAFRLRWGALAIYVGVFAALAGCRKASQPQLTSPSAKMTVQTVEPPLEGTLGSEDCGLSAYPVSRTSQQIVADAPHEGKQPPSSTMLAKVAIDVNGRVTHLRVLRLAYPEAPNLESINEQAVDSIKRWHYAPTMFGGKAVTVCSDIAVTIDLGSN
jgi:hypothetical protein